MKRFRNEVKRFMVMLLSACLVLQQGAVSTLAAETGPLIASEAAVEGDLGIASEADFEIGTVKAETASASDAVSEETASAASEKEETASAASEDATSSNAMFDEDGFLLDGGVIQDVPEAEEEELIPDAEIVEEILPAPEMKTEFLDAKMAGTVSGKWYEDYDYDLLSSAHRIRLNRYLGDETDIFVPGEVTVNGVTYQTEFGSSEAENERSLFGENCADIISIELDEGVVLPGNCRYLFARCTSLKRVDLSNADTSGVTDMSHMFFACHSLTSIDLSGFDTSSVTDMGHLFSGCQSLENIDLSSFDTSAVTSMSTMFSHCYQLSGLDLSGFDTSSVIYMDYMFSDCYSIKTLDLSSFDTSSVINMISMFNFMCKLESMDISHFETGNVTDFSQMFYNCTNLVSVDASELNLSSAQSMARMFYNCSSLQTLDLRFELYQNMNMDHMLENCSSLKKLYTPNFVPADVPLPYPMYDSHGNQYTKLPKNRYSCLITADQTYIPVTGIKINTAAKTLAPGATFQLAAWPQPSNASYKGCVWSSSNESVATVDSSGLVTAVRNGTATITAKSVDGGMTVTCAITVRIPVTSVKINTTAKVIAPGSTFQLAAWPQPANATNKAVTWSSSNTAVATVSSTGLVKAVKAGTATITVKTVDGGKTAACTITVGTPVTSVKINATAKTIAPGGTFQLAAWPQPTNAANKKVTWSSSNTAVATVSSTGLVKAVKAGTATITVKTQDGGKTATCAITVGISVTSVKINVTAKTVAPGKTFQMAAWPQPTNATNKKVTWSSSNTAVAKVSSTGLVTAVKAGTATITVKTMDGGKTATCTITVGIPVTSVKINATAKTIALGKTFQLAAWPQPTNAANKKVTWSSSNAAVAKVSSTGLVTAVKKGTATITVKTADGGKTATCKITVN